LGRLSRTAHVFLDDAARPDERAIIALWRDLHPDLADRPLVAEKGAHELFWRPDRIA
jgi:hypothetical protein